MNKENKKLGMGLGALLSTKKDSLLGLVMLNLSQIQPNKKQPRKSVRWKSFVCDQRLSQKLGAR